MSYALDLSFGSAEIEGPQLSREIAAVEDITETDKRLM